MIEVLLFNSSVIALVLLVWFDTDALVEYAKIFRLDFVFDLEVFEEKQDVNPDLTYPDFLVIYHQSFLTRLLSCPKCTAFWLSLLLYFISYQVLYLLPLIMLLGLFLYYVIVLLEKKAYE